MYECIQSEDSKVLKDKHLWFYFIIVAVVAVIAGIIIGKGFQSPEFRNLNKPSWIPSSTLFIIIWSLIYIFIAYVWYLADKATSSKTPINILFGLNLFLNVAWVYVFFNVVNISASLTVMILLIILTAYMIWSLKKIINVSLLYLYLIWLLVIFFLNLQIYMENPRDLSVG